MRSSDGQRTRIIRFENTWVVHLHMEILDKAKIPADCDVDIDADPSHMLVLFALKQKSRGTVQRALKTDTENPSEDENRDISRPQARYGLFKLTG